MGIFSGLQDGLKKAGKTAAEAANALKEASKNACCLEPNKNKEKTEAQKPTEVKQ